MHLCLHILLKYLLLFYLKKLSRTNKLLSLSKKLFTSKIFLQFGEAIGHNHSLVVWFPMEQNIREVEGQRPFFRNVTYHH